MNALTLIVTPVGKGLLKVMSKMGVSTFQSYCGAQIFEAVDCRRRLWTDIFAARCRKSAALALPILGGKCITGINWLMEKTIAMIWTPAAIMLIGFTVRRICGRRCRFPNFSIRCALNILTLIWNTSRQINEQGEKLMTLRGMLDIEKADSPVPLEEVESAVEIVRRFFHRRHVFWFNIA